MNENEVKEILERLKINGVLIEEDLIKLEELIFENSTPVPVDDLQKYVTESKYVIIDRLWELKVPIKLHDNLIIEFLWGELKAIAEMENMLDGRGCSNVTIRGDGIIQGNGKAGIPVDFRWDKEWVTHNKVYDIKIKGGTDVCLDFTNNSEFLLSGQWEINGTIDWTGINPIRYSDYGIRCRSSGGQNTIIGGSINGCKKGDIFMSGGTLKIFGGALCTNGSEANIVIQGDNAGNWLHIFGSWMENNGKPNILVNGTKYSIGIIDLHGVQIFTNKVPNIVGSGIKRLDYLCITGGAIINNDSDYCVDADICVLSKYLLCHGNWRKAFANLERIIEVRH